MARTKKLKRKGDRVWIRLPLVVFQDLQKSLTRNLYRQVDEEMRRLDRLYGGRHAAKAIDLYRGMRMSIYAEEHPPPHFHIVTDEGEASYCILKCKRIAGDLEVSSRILKKWWRANRRMLVETWNSTRPTDCPVGEMVMPSDW